MQLQSRPTNRSDPYPAMPFQTSGQSQVVKPRAAQASQWRSKSYMAKRRVTMCLDQFVTFVSDRKLLWSSADLPVEQLPPLVTPLQYAEE
jgi:hypothetical protein